MESVLLDMRFLESFASGHLSDDCLEGEDLESMYCSLESESSLPSIQSLKDKGNTLFRQNRFDDACMCYDKACKFLSFLVGTSVDYDYKSYVSLGVSLNLNLAACALKVQEYEGARNMCDLVLSFFSRNVKALFRRALAFKKLNMFLEAKKDLEKALMIEPKNRDILREIDVIKNHIAKNNNGKRNTEEFDVSDAIRQAKRPTHDVGTEMNNIVDECRSPLCDASLNSPKGNESCTLNQASLGSNAHLVRNKDFVVNQDNIGTKVISFSKKGGGHSRLQISMNTYQKLIDGQKVSFYNKYQVATMTIRVRNVPNDALKEKVSPPSKQKRRKKRLRKKAFKKEIATTVEPFCPPAKRYAYASLKDDCASQQANSSSSCNVVSPHQIVTCPLLKNENDATLLSEVSVDPAVHRPFCFSSTTKNCRRLTAKRLLTKRKHCRRGEPLRYISPFFSGKFPRSCDVSMSHQMYSPMVQVQKKRKLTSSDKSYYSESPLKKPRVMFNYFSSFVCNISNIVVAPDPEGHRASM